MTNKLIQYVLMVCPSLPMPQGVPIKLCKQQTALENPAIKTGVIISRMKDFPPEALPWQ